MGQRTTMTVQSARSKRNVSRLPLNPLKLQLGREHPRTGRDGCRTLTAPPCCLMFHAFAGTLQSKSAEGTGFVSCTPQCGCACMSRLRSFGAAARAGCAEGHQSVHHGAAQDVVGVQPPPRRAEGRQRVARSQARLHGAQLLRVCGHLDLGPVLGGAILGHQLALHQLRVPPEAAAHPAKHARPGHTAAAAAAVAMQVRGAAAMRRALAALSPCAATPRTCRSPPAAAAAPAQPGT